MMASHYRLILSLSFFLFLVLGTAQFFCCNLLNTFEETIWILQNEIFLRKTKKTMDPNKNRGHILRIKKVLIIVEQRPKKGKEQKNKSSFTYVS
jgi:hypothetical protein